MTPRTPRLRLLAISLVVLCASCEPGAPPPPPAATPAPNVRRPIPDRVRAEQLYYPIANCVACGAPLGHQPLLLNLRARLAIVCSAPCRAAALANAQKVLGRIDQAYIETQRETYPLTVCVVCNATTQDSPPSDLLLSWAQHSWDPRRRPYACAIGSRRLVRLCGAGCRGRFERAAADQQERYMHRINTALIARQLPDYPSELCPVSKRKMGPGTVPAVGDPVGNGYRDFLLHTTLIRVCCDTCLLQIQRHSDWMRKGAADLGAQPRRRPPKIRVEKGCCTN